MDEGISGEIALIWIFQDLTNDKSRLVQLMTRWHQQTITWANVDPDLRWYRVSLGHNDLT